MGNSPSNPPDPKLTINKTVNQQLSVLNSATQNCSTSVNNNQTIVVKCDAELLAKYPTLCQNVYIHDVDMKQVATLNAQCLQESAMQGVSAEELKKASDEAVKQLTNDFKIIDQVQQDTIENLVTNLTTSVTNSFTQDCVADVTNKQGILVQNAGNIEIANINMDQTAQAISNCTLKTSAVQGAIQKLADFVQQTVPPEEPSSMEKGMNFIRTYGFFVGWGIVLLIGLLVGAIKNKYFLLIMIIILCGFVVIQSFSVEKSWPYDSGDPDQNQKIMVTFSIVGGLCILILFGIFWWSKKTSDSMSTSSTLSTTENI